MPFRMSYTDPATGANYPESWWVRGHLSIADIGRYATLIFFGWVSKAHKDAGSGPFPTPFILTINDPVVFEAEIATIIEQIVAESLDVAMENVARNISDFFDAADHLSVVKPRFAEVGNHSNTRVVITMTQTPFLPSGEWDDGVTIKVNGVAATIAAADQNPFELTDLRFDLADFVLPGDEVTWEYDETAGQITDLTLLALPSVAPLSVTNNVVPVEAACLIAAQSSVTAAARMTLNAIAKPACVSSVTVSDLAITRKAAAVIAAQSSVSAAAVVGP